MHTTTICIFILQVLLIFFQCGNIYNRPSDKGRVEFLVLLLTYPNILFWTIFQPYNSAISALLCFIPGYLAVVIGIVVKLSYLIKNTTGRPINWILPTFAYLFVLLVALVANSTTILSDTQARFFVIVCGAIVTLIIAAIHLINLLKTRIGKQLFSNLFAFKLMIFTGLIGLTLCLLLLFKSPYQALMAVLAWLCFIPIYVEYYKRNFRQIHMEDHIVQMQLQKVVNDFQSKLKGEVKAFKITIVLTKREKEVLFLLQNGKDFDEIADEFHITPKTVHKHASNMYNKFGCHEREELVQLIESGRYAIK